jgi:hypothetical protein
MPQRKASSIWASVSFSAPFAVIDRAEMIESGEISVFCPLGFYKLLMSQ